MRQLAARNSNYYTVEENNYVLHQNYIQYQRFFFQKGIIIVQTLILRVFQGIIIIGETVKNS